MKRSNDLSQKISNPTVKVTETNPHQTYKQAKSKIKGSIEKYLHYTKGDLQKMNPKELRVVVSKLASASNKRLKNFSKLNIESPATANVYSSGGKFSVKGKNTDDLIDEYFRAKRFLKSETGTIKGYYKFLEKVKKGFKKAGLDIDAETGKNLKGKALHDYLSPLLDAFRKASDLDPMFNEREYKYKVLNKMTEYVNSGLTVNQVVEKAQDYLEDLYLRRQREQQQSSVSDYFQIHPETVNPFE